jgi:hypothetical protein
VTSTKKSQRQKVQNSYKTLLEERKRNTKEKEKAKHCQKSTGPLPGGKEALISKTLLKVMHR